MAKVAIGLTEWGNGSQECKRGLLVDAPDEPLSVPVALGKLASQSSSVTIQQLY